jgi:cytochrome P450
MDEKAIPAGPHERYDPSKDLLGWLGKQFETFGDTYRASLFGGDAYVTRDPRLAEIILVDRWQNYVKGDFIKRIAFLLGNGLMVSKGELWKRQRRLMQPAFHAKAVASITDVVVAANRRVLDQWRAAAASGQDINVTRDVSAAPLEVILTLIFGDDYPAIAPAFEILSSDPARNLEFARAFRRLGTIVLDAAARRREANSDRQDILAMLVRARDEKGRPLTDRLLVDEVITLIVAGHETTASTMNFMWYLISQHPDVEKRLWASLDAAPDGTYRCEYARQVIEETLRLYPAGWLMTRKALRDDQLDDWFVPAKTEIYIAPYFIQRNPALWTDPDRFDPERFSAGQTLKHRRAMLPFSAGPRNCIGEALARLEMQVHIEMIAKHLRLRYVASKPLELEAGVNLRNKYDFVMTPELRPAA